MYYSNFNNNRGSENADIKVIKLSIDIFLDSFCVYGLHNRGLQFQLKHIDNIVIFLKNNVLINCIMIVITFEKYSQLYKLSPSFTETHRPCGLHI